MNTDEASLDRLHDIVMPPPAPLWPPAPGALIVLVIIAAAVALLAIRAFVRWQRNRYRREALSELAAIENARLPPGAFATSIAILLKRAALTAYPRNETASLTGATWHAFLDRTAGTANFASNIGPLLAPATYNPRAASITTAQTRDIIASARHWIRHHQAPLP